MSRFTMSAGIKVLRREDREFTAEIAEENRPARLHATAHSRRQWGGYVVVVDHADASVRVEAMGYGHKTCGGQPLVPVAGHWVLAFEDDVVGETQLVHYSSGPGMSGFTKAAARAVADSAEVTFARGMLNTGRYRSDRVLNWVTHYVRLNTTARDVAGQLGELGQKLAQLVMDLDLRQ